jgi:hypothetical protein
MGRRKRFAKAFPKFDFRRAGPFSRLLRQECPNCTALRKQMKRQLLSASLWKVNRWTLKATLSDRS